MYLPVTKVEWHEQRLEGADCCIWMFISLRTVSGVVLFVRRDIGVESGKPMFLGRT